MEIRQNSTSQFCKISSEQFDADFTSLRETFREKKIDLIRIPKLLEKPKLFVFDMDSTLIHQEVIDELARAHGVYEEVAKITAEAMNGGLDFAAALQKRVAALKGLEIETFQKVYRSLTLQSGVLELFQFLKKHETKIIVLSGGFSPILEMFQKEYGITEFKANHLKNVKGIFTGEIEGEIIDSIAKKKYTLEFASQFKIPIEEVVVVGDGANDSLMIKTTPFGFGFHAKEGLKKQITNWFDFSPMNVLESLFETTWT